MAHNREDDLSWRDDPPEAAAESAAGLAAYERGDREEAERRLRRADELGGRWGAFRLGFLFEEQGDRHAATAAYRRAIERGSGEAARNLGLMHKEQGDIDQARQLFTTAVKLGHSIAIRDLDALGNVLIDGPDGVQTDLGTTGELTLTLARNNYLASKLTASQYEQQLRKFLNHSHDRTARFAAANLAQLKEQHGDVAQAEQLYRRVLAGDDPGVQFYPASANALANLLVQRGDNDEAERLWRQAMASNDPDISPMAAVNLGAALAIWKRPDEAQAVLQVAIDSRHPNEAPAALLRRGIIYYQQGDYTTARSVFSAVRAIGHREFSPQATRFLFELAKVSTTATGQPGSSPRSTPPAPATGTDRQSSGGLWSRIRHWLSNNPGAS